MSALQKIADIQFEISRTQKNKATNSHLGLLKAKLAKLKSEILLGSKSSGPGVRCIFFYSPEFVGRLTLSLDAFREKDSTLRRVATLA